MNSRIERLEKSHWLYWNNQEPLMTDQEYDKEIQWLKTIQPNHWLLQNIGGEIGDVIHEKPMLSLNKAYSFEELKKFIQKAARTPEEKFYCQIKFDGLAALYENGVLSTRGNGRQGKNISHKLPMISLIQGKGEISWSRTRKSLGEIVCSLRTFKDKGEGFKTPRNFVAGVINKKQNDDIKLHFVEYDTATKYFFTAKNFTEERWNKIREFYDECNTYPMDGLVIKLADQEYADSLGCTEHHPLGAIAFKFANEQTTSTLLSVDWQPGKNKLTPVANIEPVELGGVVISRATLHNYQHVRDLNLFIGDEVVIERSGDVIPHLLSARRTVNSTKKVLISSCPACGHTIEIDGPDIRCKNFDCPGTSFARFLYSIKEFEIENIGEGNAMKLFRANIKNIFSLFKLKREGYINAGISPKIADKIIASIKAKSVMKPEYILAGLAIDGLGRATWKTILNYISFEELTTTKLSIGALTCIPGIELVTAKKIRQGLIQKKCEIDEIMQVVTVETNQEKNKELPTICFTGKMPETRKYYEQLASENGYAIADNVKADLSVLVVADQESNSSKIQKARKNNIRIITLKEWLDEINN